MGIFSSLKLLDDASFLMINQLPHPPILDQAFLFFSFYPLFIWLLIGIIVVIVEERKEKVFLVRLVLALSMAGILASGIIKPIIKRPRPDITYGDQVNVVEEKKVSFPGHNNFAFPSGHAAVAFAGAYVVMREETRGQHAKLHALKRRQWMRLIFFAFAVLTAFSRIYLGKHYPLDVVAGGLLGWGMGWVSWKIIDIIRPPRVY